MKTVFVITLGDIVGVSLLVVVLTAMAGYGIYRLVTSARKRRE